MRTMQLKGRLPSILLKLDQPIRSSPRMPIDDLFLGTSMSGLPPLGLSGRFTTQAPA